MHDERREGSNPTHNRPFHDVLEARLSRRGLIAGGLAAGGAAFLAGSGLAGVADAAPVRTGSGWGHGGWGHGNRSLVGFDPVLPSFDDDVVVAPGYVVDVLIPWGTPIRSNGPAWRKDASNSAAEQAEQVGMHHDGMHFFPLGWGWAGSRRGLLVLNHEYVDPTLLTPDGAATLTPEKVAKALAAHGVTVIEITRARDGSWTPVDGWFNRRVTGTTPMAFSGPVRADHPALQSELGNPPTGTLNDCAHGATPWGTYLACEENWNGYFGTEDPSWSPTPSQARYGVSASGFGYGWHTVDPRFDVAQNGNELHRFGWVVEVDPFDPRATPVKRTALGRIKHEGATVTESRGRAVVYTGDDENGDYFYKFVSAGSWRSLRARGRSPLDEGTLHVAVLSEDGSGRWVPLVHGTGPFTAAGGWVDQADVLLRTREAADAVGATPLDRPEWCSVHPRTGDVYLTLTNGSSGPNGPNPRNPNPYGHILRITPRHGDHTRDTFAWDVFLLAGDPAYDPTVELDETNMFGSPDGIWVDPDGRVWIETDISNSSQWRADRGYDRIGNNQVLCADPGTGEVKRFLVGPRGCELTGIITTPDQRTMFINVQHPGDSTTAIGSPTPADPQVVSSWPDHDPDGRPRSATLVVRRADGGKIGT